jgi:hypothetical protein
MQKHPIKKLILMFSKRSEHICALTRLDQRGSCELSFKGAAGNKRRRSVKSLSVASKRACQLVK